LREGYDAIVLEGHGRLPEAIQKLAVQRQNEHTLSVDPKTALLVILIIAFDQAFGGPLPQRQAEIE
jgi:hypothetical protein